MSALPPPQFPFDCTLLGLEIGVIYGAGAAFAGLGLAAVIFPLLGSLIGFVCDQSSAY